MENNLNEQLADQKLSIKKVRESLASIVGLDLTNEGFKIDKKLSGAKKTISKKNKIEIKFDCYDYLPSSIEFRLIIIFSIEEIDNEADLLYKYSNEVYNKGYTIILTEGDFHPKSKNLNPKLRNAATHILTNMEMLNEATHDCQSVVRNEIIPYLSRYSKLEEFQKYIMSDFDHVINYGLFVPALIATKLMGNEELDKLVNFLWEKLKLDSKSSEHIQRKLVTNIYSYKK